MRFTKKFLKEAFTKMVQAKSLTEVFEDHFKQASKYVHATSRGHEVIQLAVGMQLKPQDYLYPYYRDDSILLAIGIRPLDLILQLHGKKDDPFSGGRTYYAHPSLRDPDKPKIPHQSSATGMQAIPATGTAMGMQYKETLNINLSEKKINIQKPITVCSLGDACITEGEVAEAFQMAALKQLPILYLVQDNGWDISATEEEVRAQNAYEYASGFKGLEAISIDGTDLEESYITLSKIIHTIRKERRPFLVHARVPLLNHHTSGVRMDFYRDDLKKHKKQDPYPKLRKLLRENNFTKEEITTIEHQTLSDIKDDYKKAFKAADPTPEDLYTHDFTPTEITEEKGERLPQDAEKSVMVDCAIHALEEIMKKHPEASLYGQDVGRRLGGVFREAATLAEKFGDERVFNTAIQEAFIIGSTVGMSAVGLKPFVEVQFADYIWPGLNQLFTEVSRSNYLSNGKWPVSMVLRVPLGAYGGGGPYHSGSAESVICNIQGIKVAYPSNGADLKGLLKAAYYDPNPVVVFEHKGLYWSKAPGTKRAISIEPAEDYILPLGKASIPQEIWKQEKKETVSVITYGMGVHWALNAVEEMELQAQIEVVDLRTLAPLDMQTIIKSVEKCGKCLVVTEEPSANSFAQALAGKIQENCFQQLDAPVMTLGSENLPAIPLNETLEKTMIPSTKKVKIKIEELLNY